MKVHFVKYRDGWDNAKKKKKIKKLYFICGAFWKMKNESVSVGKSF